MENIVELPPLNGLEPIQPVETSQQLLQRSSTNVASMNPNQNTRIQHNYTIAE
jgi:hypothetical protein